MIYILEPGSEKEKETKRKNLLKQADAIEGFFLENQNNNKKYLLTIETIKILHSIAIKGILKTEFSKIRQNVEGLKPYISQSDHKISAPEEINDHLNKMCNYINGYPNKEENYFHLAAYVMWNLNWIHPFWDGNGRTSRAISLLLICIYGETYIPNVLQGPQIPHRVYLNRDEYCQCLDESDKSFKNNGEVDVSSLENLIKRMLYEQHIDHENFQTTTQ